MNTITKPNKTNNTDIKTSINFGGFYNSIHDSNIEWACESFYSDNDGNFDWNVILDKVDFKKLHGAYIDLYCDLFSEWLKENYNLVIQFKNISLSSPREYNFKTDEIICDITPLENESLIKTLQSDSKFLDWLKDRTRSKSGFISFDLVRSFNQSKNLLSLCKVIASF